MGVVRLHWADLPMFAGPHARGPERVAARTTGARRANWGSWADRLAPRHGRRRGPPFWDRVPRIRAPRCCWRASATRRRHRACHPAAVGAPGSRLGIVPGAGHSARPGAAGPVAALSSVRWACGRCEPRRHRAAARLRRCGGQRRDVTPAARADGQTPAAAAPPLDPAAKRSIRPGGRSRGPAPAPGPAHGARGGKLVTWDEEAGAQPEGGRHPANCDAGIGLSAVGARGPSGVRVRSGGGAARHPAGALGAVGGTRP